MRNLILKTNKETITIEVSAFGSYKAIWKDGRSELWSTETLVRILEQDGVSITWETV